jgi:hypothetical protein
MSLGCFILMESLYCHSAQRSNHCYASFAFLPAVGSSVLPDRLIGL